MNGALRISAGVLVLAIGAAAQQQRLEAPATVYIVTGGQATALYHREGCAWLRPGAMSALRLEEAQKRYFQPHCLCIAGKEGTPPCEGAAAARSAATTPAPASTGSTAAAAAVPAALAKGATAASNATETVYVTRTGTKYHSSGCRHLSRSRIPMTLKDASARYGPCSVCGPPVLSATPVPATPAAPASAVPVERTTTPPPTRAPTSGRCQATTKKGAQCSRRARAGSEYCWQHGD